MLIDNLELQEYTTQPSNQAILNSIMARRFFPNGRGKKAFIEGWDAAREWCKRGKPKPHPSFHQPYSPTINGCNWQEWGFGFTRYIMYEQNGS